MADELTVYQKTLRDMNDNELWAALSFAAGLAGEESTATEDLLNEAARRINTLSNKVNDYEYSLGNANEELTKTRSRLCRAQKELRELKAKQ